MTAYPRTERLESVSIIIPVINETTSLDQTIEIILGTVDHALIREFLVVVCKKTTAESMAVIAELQRKHGPLIVLLHQRRPFIGGALRDAFDDARGTHVLMMASDLETDPADVCRLIAEEAGNPNGIVTASRWLAGGSFEGYSKVKLVCNRIFQVFFSLLYGTHLSDMTFAYRIMPARLAKSILWEELRHPFGFETILKPLRLHVPIAEIASAWKSRVEGESQNTFLRNFEYFRIGMKVLFARQDSLIKTSEPAVQSSTQQPVP